MTTLTSAPSSAENLLSKAGRALCSGLRERGLTNAQVDNLLEEYRARAGTRALSEMFVEHGFATEGEVARWLAKAHGLPLAVSADYTVQADVARLLSRALCRQRGVLPVRREAGQVVILCYDPEMPQFAQVTQALTQHPHRFVIAPRSDILAVMDSLDAPAIRLESENEWASFVEAQFKEMSLTPGASDLHVVPEEHTVQIKFRIDGKLVARRTVAAEFRDRLTTALKLSANRAEDGRTLIKDRLGGIDVAIRTRPQDGSAVRRYGSKRMGLRYSFIPTLFGESVVVRFLDQDAQVGDLGSLGMLPDHVELYRAAVRKADGLIINCGPTGHGKSTTLAAAVQYIDIHNKRVITIEDPVEYRLRGVTQIQANVSPDMGFAEVLRALMRHNPNVIILGAMRDPETAKSGLSLSNTGHLLLTTTHANTGLGGIIRLIDLAVEPAMVAASIQLLLGQRLVRRVCIHCRQPHTRQAELMDEHGETLERAKAAKVIRGPLGFFEAGPGCAACSQTGYRGRMAILELRKPDSVLRKRISDEKHEFDLAAAERSFVASFLAGRLSDRTLLMDGMFKAAMGWTTPEEVFSASSIE